MEPADRASEIPFAGAALLDGTNPGDAKQGASKQGGTQLDGARLDGLFERIRVAPFLTVVLGLIVGFLVFQGLSLVVALALIAMTGGLDSLVSLQIDTLLARYAREFLVANTVGQVVGLLVLAYAFARLHTRQAGAFLRFRAPDARFTALSIVGLVALVPVVHWLGMWSDALPWPESIRSFEAVQLDLIEQVLSHDLGLVFTLFTMAVTPAVCEEAFFRGYIQRQAERTFSAPAAAVVFSGIVFGLYHVRPTQALPLSLLGIYLAYITWRSGSLWPAIVVHFANNGFAVVVGGILSRGAEPGTTELDTMQVPIFVLLPAAILSAAVWVALERRGRVLKENSVPGSSR